MTRQPEHTPPTNLAPTPGHRLTLVPDLDGEPLTPLSVLEEVLLTLREWETDPDDPVRLPPPIAARRGLEAVNHLQAALTPSQHRTADGARLLAPLRNPGSHTGHYEHLPITLIRLAADTLETFRRLLADLDPRNATFDVIDAAEQVTHAYGTTHRDLVADLERLHTLLTLDWDDDARLLAPRLADRDHGRDVYLTDAEEAAYQRLADRLNAAAGGDALARWLY